MAVAPEQSVQAYYDTNAGRWMVQMAGGWVPVPPDKQGPLQDLAQRGLVTVVQAPAADPRLNPDYGTPVPMRPTSARDIGPAIGEARRQQAAVPQYPTGANAAAIGPAIGQYRRQQAAPSPAPGGGAATALSGPPTSAADAQAQMAQAQMAQTQAMLPSPGVAWENDYFNPARWAGGVVGLPQQMGAGASSLVGLPPPPQLMPRQGPQFERFAMGGMADTPMQPPPEMMPPPGMDPNAIVGEAADQGMNTGMELVIVPTDAGQYTITWTDTPVAADLEDGSIVVPIEETAPAVKAIKEQFPKLVGEPLLRRGGTFIGAETGRRFARGGRKGGMRRPPRMASGGSFESVDDLLTGFGITGMGAGTTTSGPRDGTSAAAPPPAAPGPSGRMWELRNTARGAQGQTIQPWIGVTPDARAPNVGNLSWLQRLDPVLRERVMQEMHDRGWLGGADALEAYYRALAPGVRAGSVYAG